MKKYLINLDGLGDSWYALIALQDLYLKTNEKIHVWNACKPLTPIIQRLPFIESVNNFDLKGEEIKLFQFQKAREQGVLLLNCSTIDFVSKIALGTTVTERAMKYPKIQTRVFPKYDLVFHTAKTWDSRSISETVWNELYKKYSADYSIAIIGKTVAACDMTKGIQKLNVPEQDDYTDKLSLDETMNLIDSSRVLVTGQGGISVLSAGLDVNVVVAEGCVHKEFRLIDRGDSMNSEVFYVKNNSNTYHTGEITLDVTGDTRQQPSFEDMVTAIDKALKI